MSIRLPGMTGTREWVYPQSIDGSFMRLRRGAFLLLHLVLFVVPWITLNGHPLLLIDLPHRRVFLFGAIFTPSDTIFLALLLFFLAFSLFTGVHGLFQHANVDVRLGGLNWVFSMAELHRWHHSRTVAEANHNYGNNLIVWDLVFGTYFLPRDRTPPEDIGLADLPDFPTTFFGQLLAPLRWKKIRGR